MGQIPERGAGVAVNHPYLSVGQCERLGQVGSLGIELQEGSEVATLHGVVQPPGVCLLSTHHVATLGVLGHNVLLPRIPRCSVNRFFLMENHNKRSKNKSLCEHMMSLKEEQGLTCHFVAVA